MKVLTKKQIYVLMILVIAIPLFAGLTLVIRDAFTAEVVSKYKAEVTIGRHVGFNVDNTTMTFGTVPQFSPGATRDLKYYNNNSYSLYPETKAYGIIAPMLRFDAPEVIEPYSMGKISVNLVPGNASLGYYDGSVTIVLRKRLR